MELNSQAFCGMICYNFQFGLSKTQNLEYLQAALGHGAPSRSTVFAWFAEFKRGWRCLEDESQRGRPAVSGVPENVERVQQLVVED